MCTPAQITASVSIRLSWHQIKRQVRAKLKDDPAFLLRFRSNNDEYAKERWETLSEEDRAQPWPLWANPSTGDRFSLRRSLKSRTALAVQRSERALLCEPLALLGTVCLSYRRIRTPKWVGGVLLSTRHWRQHELGNGKQCRQEEPRGVCLVQWQFLRDRVRRVILI